MKNKALTITHKDVALVVSWLTLSPLLLILDGRWKLLYGLVERLSKKITIDLYLIKVGTVVK